MPTIEAEYQGQVYEIDVPPGQTPEQAVAEFEASVGARPDSTLGEDIGRGLGLGGRAVVGAAPRAAAGLADLIGTGLNAVQGGIDTADRFVAENVFGREPRDPVAPAFGTGASQAVNEVLNQVFPEPANAPERIVQLAGEALLTGGAGARALARAPGTIKPTPTMQRGGTMAPEGRVAQRTDTRGVGRGLGEDIAEFQAREPIKAGAAEFLGGAGAAGAGEATRAADLGPGAELGATVVGGILGGMAPSAGVTAARQAAVGIGNKVPGLMPGLRAARELQGTVTDPRAAGQTAMDAPEGVTPAQATQNPRLMAMETRARLDDPEVNAKVTVEQAAAEEASLDRLARTFDAEPTNPAEWQRQVIERAAPEGTSIAGTQPDEMVEDAFTAFRGAYDEAHGYPVQTQVVQVEGGNVPLPERISDALNDPRVLAGNKTRKRIGRMVGELLADVSDRRGTPLGAEDSGVVQFFSEDLLELRHAVRRELRSQRKPENVQLLRNVDDAITETLESQLPEAASDALRATDARYADFRVVADAVARGKGDLTPQQLRSALSSSRSTLQRARGDTGAIGQLAEVGMPGSEVLKPSTTPQQIQRARRNMTPEQEQSFKADVLRAIGERRGARGTDVQGEGNVVRGEKLLKEVELNREKLKAAGFTDDDFRRIETAGKELAMIQRRSPGEVKALLEDDVGRLFRLFAAVAGSRGGMRALQFFGGAAGAGPQLVLAQFGSRQMQQMLTNLSVDKADELIRQALVDRELFNALMTKPTDAIKKQAQAARTINAWLAQTAPEDDGEE